MKLDGIGLFVDDMPTMVRFYRDVLGFEIALYVDTFEEVDMEYTKAIAFYNRIGYKVTGHRLEMHWEL